MFLLNGQPVTKITWTAPTKNTDGTDVVGPLNYQLYVDGVAQVSFPGVLNPNGDFEQELAPLGVFTNDGTFEVYLTTIDGLSRESDPSGSIFIEVRIRPNPPTNLAAV